jgi:hypothetical protein
MRPHELGQLQAAKESEIASVAPPTQQVSNKCRAASADFLGNQLSLAPLVRAIRCGCLVEWPGFGSGDDVQGDTAESNAAL